MKVIVIGAGASGLLYSHFAASAGAEVLLLEKNSKPGRKVAITGKGRCNLTNKTTPNGVIENVVSNPKFLYSAINGFTPEDTISFFEEHGCPLKVERGNRVFPVSDKAGDIVSTLERVCAESGVKIFYGYNVTKVERKEEGFVVYTRTRVFKADKLVLATGGKSYPLTGSTGDGYRFASDLGHHITPIKSALCPIKIKERVDHSMLSLTLKNVSLSFMAGKKGKSLFGDLEFLPNSLTGPIALSMSSLLNKEEGEISLTLDFKPALDEEKLLARLLREIQGNPNKDVSYLLSSLLPQAIIPFFLRGVPLEEKTPLHSFKKEDRSRLLQGLKRFPLTYDGLEDISKGIVTCGGVDVKEVSSKTMESKLVPGLYLIGELLDVDAFTGGFNLQIAFSTAYMAAKALEE